MYAPAVKNRKTGELCVCGFNAVSALCEAHPERVRRLFLSAERAPAFGAACKRLAADHRPYKVAENEELERLSKSLRHQGVVAMCDPPIVGEATAETLDRWKRTGERVCVLEDVGNDHNLGAIARSAAFFGVRTILLCGEGSASITTSAYRVAEGGMERVEFYSTADPVRLFKGSGFKLVGSDSRGGAPLGGPGALPSGPEGWGLVLGNEESGLTREMRSVCERFVSIPGAGKMDSLNVAQAAAVLFSRIPLRGEGNGGVEEKRRPPSRKGASRPVNARNRTG